MQVQIEARDFQAAIKAMNLVADKSSYKPILANCHIHANGNREAVFRATDYERSAAYTVPADVAEPGDVVLNPAMIAGSIPKAGPVVIASAQEWAQVGESLRLPTVEPGLYPCMDVPEPQHAFTVSAETLRRALDFAGAFCGKNETRQNLMGLQFATAPLGQATLTATDGDVLGQCKLDIVPSLGPCDDMDIIIPRASAVLLVRLLKGDKSESVAVGIIPTTGASGSTGQMVVTFGHVQLVTRLIDGKFPNVDPCIPRDNPLAITVDAATFTAKLKVVAAMSRDKIKPTVLTVWPGDALSFESEPAEHGQAVEHMAAMVRGLPRPVVRVGFNAPYLLDALKAFGTERVTLHLEGSLKPCLVTSDLAPAFLAVVMPLRTEWVPTVSKSPGIAAPVIAEASKAAAPTEPKPAHKRKAKAPVAAVKNPAPTPKPVTTPQGGLSIVRCSERAVIVKGNREVFGARIDATVPKYSRRYDARRGGWIFSAKREAVLRKALADLLDSAA